MNSDGTMADMTDSPGPALSGGGPDSYTDEAELSRQQEQDIITACRNMDYIIAPLLNSIDFIDPVSLDRGGSRLLVHLLKLIPIFDTEWFATGAALIKSANDIYDTFARAGLAPFRYLHDGKSYEAHNDMHDSVGISVTFGRSFSATLAELGRNGSFAAAIEALLAAEHASPQVIAEALCAVFSILGDALLMQVGEHAIDPNRKAMAISFLSDVWYAWRSSHGRQRIAKWVSAQQHELNQSSGDASMLSEQEKMKFSLSQGGSPAAPSSRQSDQSVSSAGSTAAGGISEVLTTNNDARNPLLSAAGQHASPVPRLPQVFLHPPPAPSLPPGLPLASHDSPGNLLPAAIPQGRDLLQQPGSMHNRPPQTPVQQRASDPALGAQRPVATSGGALETAKRAWASVKSNRQDVRDDAATPTVEPPRSSSGTSPQEVSAMAAELAAVREELAHQQLAFQDLQAHARLAIQTGGGPRSSSAKPKPTETLNETLLKEALKGFPRAVEAVLKSMADVGAYAIPEEGEPKLSKSQGDVLKQLLYIEGTSFPAVFLKPYDAEDLASVAFQNPSLARACRCDPSVKDLIMVEAVLAWAATKQGNKVFSTDVTHKVGKLLTQADLTDTKSALDLAEAVSAICLVEPLARAQQMASELSTLVQASRAAAAANWPPNYLVRLSSFQKARAIADVLTQHFSAYTYLQLSRSLENSNFINAADDPQANALRLIVLQQKFDFVGNDLSGISLIEVYSAVATMQSTSGNASAASVPQHHRSAPQHRAPALAVSAQPDTMLTDGELFLANTTLLCDVRTPADAMDAIEWELSVVLGMDRGAPSAVSIALREARGNTTFKVDGHGISYIDWKNHPNAALRALAKYTAYTGKPEDVILWHSRGVPVKIVGHLATCWGCSTPVEKRDLKAHQSRCPRSTSVDARSLMMAEIRLLAAHNASSGDQSAGAPFGFRKLGAVPPAGPSRTMAVDPDDDVFDVCCKCDSKADVIEETCAVEDARTDRARNTVLMVASCVAVRNPSFFSESEPVSWRLASAFPDGVTLVPDISKHVDRRTTDLVEEFIVVGPRVSVPGTEITEPEVPVSLPALSKPALEFIGKSSASTATGPPILRNPVESLAKSPTPVNSFPGQAAGAVFGLGSAKPAPPVRGSALAYSEAVRHPTDPPIGGVLVTPDGLEPLYVSGDEIDATDTSVPTNSVPRAEELRQCASVCVKGAPKVVEPMHALPETPCLAVPPADDIIKPPHVHVEEIDLDSDVAMDELALQLSKQLPAYPIEKTQPRVPHLRSSRMDVDDARVAHGFDTTNIECSSDSDWGVSDDSDGDSVEPKSAGPPLFKVLPSVPEAEDGQGPLTLTIEQGDPAPPAEVYKAQVRNLQRFADDPLANPRPALDQKTGLPCRREDCGFYDGSPSSADYILVFGSPQRRAAIEHDPIQQTLRRAGLQGDLDYSRIRQVLIPETGRSGGGVLVHSWRYSLRITSPETCVLAKGDFVIEGDKKNGLGLWILHLVWTLHKELFAELEAIAATLASVASSRGAAAVQALSAHEPEVEAVSMSSIAARDLGNDVSHFPSDTRFVAARLFAVASMATGNAVAVSTVLEPARLICLVISSELTVRRAITFAVAGADDPALRLHQLQDINMVLRRAAFVDLWAGVQGSTCKVLCHRVPEEKITRVQDLAHGWLHASQAPGLLTAFNHVAPPVLDGYVVTRSNAAMSFVAAYVDTPEAVDMERMLERSYISWLGVSNAWGAAYFMLMARLHLRPEGEPVDGHLHRPTYLPVTKASRQAGASRLGLNWASETMREDLRGACARGPELDCVSNMVLDSKSSISDGVALTLVEATPDDVALAAGPASSAGYIQLNILRPNKGSGSSPVSVVVDTGSTHSLSPLDMAAELCHDRKSSNGHVRAADGRSIAFLGEYDLYISEGKCAKQGAGGFVIPMQAVQMGTGSMIIGSYHLNLLHARLDYNNGSVTLGQIVVPMAEITVELCKAAQALSTASQVAYRAPPAQPTRQSCRLCIANGMVIDTGAFSAIARYDESTGREPTFDPTPQALVGVGGKFLSKGTVDKSISWEGKSFSFKAICVDNLPVPLLIGRQQMIDTGMVIDYGTQHVTCTRGPLAGASWPMQPPSVLLAKRVSNPVLAVSDHEAVVAVGDPPIESIVDAERCLLFALASSGNMGAACLRVEACRAPVAHTEGVAAMGSAFQHLVAFAVRHVQSDANVVVDRISRGRGFFEFQPDRFVPPPPPPEPLMRVPREVPWPVLLGAEEVPQGDPNFRGEGWPGSDRLHNFHKSKGRGTLSFLLTSNATEQIEYLEQRQRLSVLQACSAGASSSNPGGDYDDVVASQRYEDDSSKCLFVHEHESLYEPAESSPGTSMSVNAPPRVSETPVPQTPAAAPPMIGQVRIMRREYVKGGKSGSYGKMLVNVCVDAATYARVRACSRRVGVFQQSTTVKALERPRIANIGSDVAGDNPGQCTNWSADTLNGMLDVEEAEAPDGMVVAAQICIPVVIGAGRKARLHAGDCIGSYTFLEDSDEVTACTDANFETRAKSLTNEATVDHVGAASVAALAVLKAASWDRESCVAELDASIDGVDVGLDVETPSPTVPEDYEANASAVQDADVSAPISEEEIIATAAHLEDPVQRKALETLLLRYRQCFGRDNTSLKPANLDAMPDDLRPHIDTGDAAPQAARAYRMNIKTMAIMKTMVREHLASGVIVPCRSAWAAPALIVPKPHGGGWRFVVDYRRLNSVLKTERYPVPRAEDCLDALAGKSIFSSMDMLAGFHQIPLRKKDMHKLAFVAADGQYTFTTMPMGLASASSVFQRMISTVLSGLLFVTAIAYIDDVLVFSDSFDQHLKDLEVVLARFDENHLMMKLSKCKFCRASVPFLGFIVQEQGISMDPTKVSAVADWKFELLTSKTRVKSFLGLAGYYRRYVKHFAHLSEPLRELTGLETNFAEGILDPAVKRSFDTIKSILISPDHVLLAHPRFEDHFDLRVDACDSGIGAVLEQADKQGRPRVVCYISRPLSKTERVWAIAEREALAIIWAVEKLRIYLSDDYTIWTDHHNLAWIMDAPPERGRLARWALRLSEFPGIRDKIKFIKGDKNGAADGLSRTWAEEPAAYSVHPAPLVQCVCENQLRYSPMCFLCHDAPATAEYERSSRAAEDLCLQASSSIMGSADAAALQDASEASAPLRLAPQATRRLFGISVYAGVGSEGMLSSEVDWIYVESNPVVIEFLHKAGRIVFPSLEVLLSLIERKEFSIPYPDILVLTPSCKGYSTARFTSGRAPPVPPCSEHFIGIPALLFRLRDAGILPRTVMIEMVAQPLPRERGETADSARVRAAFDLVIKGLKECYPTVHYGNYDFSEYGSPISKTHWVAQASSLNRLTKMKNRMGGIACLPRDRLLPGNDPRVRHAYMNFREVTEAPPTRSLERPSQHGWDKRFDDLVGATVSSASLKGVVVQFVVPPAGVKGAYLHLIDEAGDHQLSEEDATGLTRQESIPILRPWQLDRRLTDPFFSSFIRRPIPESLSNGGSTRKSKHLYRIMRRSNAQGHTEDGSSRSDQLKGTYVQCPAHPFTAFTSYARLDSRFYENSKFTNNMVLDPVTGKPRVIIPFEIAKLKGWSDRYANFIQDWYDSGPEGEYSAQLLLANALELDAWQHFMDNLTSCIRGHDAGLEEQATRARNAAQRLLQEEIYGKSSLALDAPLTRANLITAQMEDPQCAHLRDLVANGVEDDANPRDETQKLAEALFLVDDLLMYSALVAKRHASRQDLPLSSVEDAIVRLGSRSGGLRAFIPPFFRSHLIDIVHTSNLHLKHSRMCSMLEKSTFWPGMVRDIKERIRCCPICQYALRMKATNAGLAANTQSISFLNFFDRISLDYVSVDPLLTTQKLNTAAAEHKYRGFMSVIDHSSSFMFAFLLSEHTAADTARALLTLLKLHGVPKEILSDRGGEFVNSVWDLVLESVSAHGPVKRTLTTPYRPNTNGKSEVSHRWLLERVRSMVLESGSSSSWPTLLESAVSVYNNSKTETSEYTPYQLAWGRDPRSFLDAIIECPVVDLVKKPEEVVLAELQLSQEFMRDKRYSLRRVAAEKMRSRVNKGRYEVKYAPGEKVLLEDERAHVSSATSYVTPKLRSQMHAAVYSVVKVLPSGNVLLQSVARRKAKSIERHPSKLRRYVPLLDGTLSPNRYSEAQELELNDFCLVELEPGKGKHEPYCARIIGLDGDFVTYHIYDASKANERKLGSAGRCHKKVFINDAGVTFYARPGRGCIEYVHQGGVECVVSSPFELDAKGHVPLEAYEEAKTRCEHSDLIDWVHTMKGGLSLPHLMKSQQGASDPLEGSAK